jgi:formylmethanofuran dehydrogenase subunit E
MNNQNEQGNHSAATEYASFEENVRFHGHACPGLAMGYRAAIAAMQALGVERPKDEELVAIAETDACGVDAVQFVTGCTAGKGNLIIRDYGKHVFTFYDRRNGRAVRVLIRQNDMRERTEMDELRKKVFTGTADEKEVKRFYQLMNEVTRKLLVLPVDQVLKIEEVRIEPPNKARIFTSIACAGCGEPVADAKTRTLGGKQVCIPCFEEGKQGE